MALSERVFFLLLFLLTILRPSDLYVTGLHLSVHHPDTEHVLIPSDPIHTHNAHIAFRLVQRCTC